MPPKTVLIIGAGPAGLVAAKTLLQYNGGKSFNVTVFESAERVGGMWRARADEHGDKCNPHMRTNLSRFTVAFSDLSWGSVDLSDPKRGLPAPIVPPMFPEAWHVGRYLETYAKAFIPDGVVHCDREVTGADIKGDGPSHSWVISSCDKNTGEHYTDSFDQLLVASGFFERPSHHIGLAKDILTSEKVNVHHSTEFRNIASLVDSPGDIAVIGGGISGSEAATTAAFQISSAKYSPGEKPPWVNSKVYHVFNRPFYNLTRYLPQDPYNAAIQDFNLSPAFLPLDLVLYNLSRRGNEEIRASNGQVPEEKARKGHEFLRLLLGGDQREYGRPELVHRPDTTQYPGFTGINDMYAEFVRSGLIVPILGRVQSISRQTVKDGTSSAVDLLAVNAVPQPPWTYNSPEHFTSTEIKDLASVIEATGFELCLPYLSNRVKEALSYDSNCHRIPLLLSRASILNPRLPTIGFVGFYEGPFWGVMELQAHKIAQVWTEGSGVQGADQKTLDTVELLQVRQAIKENSLDVPQFWMNDYVGLVEELSREVGIVRDESVFKGQSGPAFAARYSGTKDDPEAAKTIREVADILQSAQSNARFVAAATFRGMQGKWTLQRKVDSRHTFSPGGIVKGEAQFHPRAPSDPAYGAEYLYIEEGTFTMDTGMSFPVTRRYVYRYDDANDAITAWFVKDDGETADYVFNTWAFHRPQDTQHGWLAEGSHWCSPDTYNSRCEFRFRGIALETFGITYDVLGPNKDYSHESWYTRPKPGAD